MKKISKDDSCSEVMRIEAMRIEEHCRKVVGLPSLAKQTKSDVDVPVDVPAHVDVPVPTDAELVPPSKRSRLRQNSEIEDQEMDLPSLVVMDLPDVKASMDLPHIVVFDSGVVDLPQIPKTKLLNTTCNTRCHNVGSNPFTRGTRLDTQARAVLANCVESVATLLASEQGKKQCSELGSVATKDLCKELLSRLGSDGNDLPKSSNKLSLAHKFVAGMSAVAGNTVKDAWQKVVMGVMPEQDAAALACNSDGNNDSEPLFSAESALVLLIRKILSNGVLGRPYQDISMDLLHMYFGIRDIVGEAESADAKLPTKYCSRWVCPVVEAMAGNHAVLAIGQHLLQPLSGLKIRTDFELFGDPYTIGALFASAKSTGMVTGIIGSTPSHNSGTTAVFVCAESSGTDDRGEAKAIKLLQGLRESPLAISATYFNKCCGSLNFDGAYCKG